MRYLALAACMSLGCSGAQIHTAPKPMDRPVLTVRTVVPNYFTPLEAHLINEGVEEWTSSLNGHLVVERSENPDREAFENMVRIQSEGHVGERGIDLSDASADAWTGCWNTLVFIRMTAEDPEAKKRSGWLGWTVTSCHIKYIVLVVDRLETPTKFQNTAAHEFGHALGMEHIHQRHVSIMFPFTGDTVKCVTELDRQLFCMKWGCDWRATRDPSNCQEDGAESKPIMVH